MTKLRKGARAATETPDDRADETAEWRVQIALDEIVASAREGLFAVAVGAGLEVMAALMEDDVTAVCGRKGRHDPRVRAGDGSGELPVPSYEEPRVRHLLLAARAVARPCPAGGRSGRTAGHDAPPFDRRRPDPKRRLPLRRSPW